MCQLGDHICPVQVKGTGKAVLPIQGDLCIGARGKGVVVQFADPRPVPLGVGRGYCRKIEPIPVPGEGKTSRFLHALQDFGGLPGPQVH